MTAAGIENANELVPAICAAFEAIGAFNPPSFMSDFEEDRDDWAESLPKVTQSYLL